MWAEIRDKFEGGVVCFDNEQADDWMMLVILFIADSLGHLLILV
jgi:hypothetical protein